MANDDDSAKSSFSGALPTTLLLAFVSVAGYLGYQPALKSARPHTAKAMQVPPPPTPPGMKALHARLWDDPIVVAWNDDSRDRKSSPSPSPGSLQAALQDQSTLVDLQRDLQAVVEQLTGGATTGSDAPTEKKFLVMPVLVPGEPFEDDTERRKRTNYAVLAAAGVSDYVLKYPDRLTYVQVPICAFDQPTNRHISLKLITPMKLFVPDPTAPAAASGNGAEHFAGVLVCWINQAQLGDRPLAALHQALTSLFAQIPPQTRRSQLELRVIGPADSDLLHDMAAEAGAIGHPDTAPPTAGRARAVLPPGYDRAGPIVAVLLAGLMPKFALPSLLDCPAGRRLRRDQYQDDFCKPVLISCMATATRNRSPGEEPAMLRGGRSNSGLRVVQAIGDDDDLVQALIYELKLRGAWPKTPTDDKCVVVLTESDTLYGRSFAESIRGEIHHADRPEDDQLQLFEYLQGIDGTLGDPKTDAVDNERQNDGPKLTDSLGASTPEAMPASGRSQFDYLRRLELHLQRLHDEKRRDGQQGITTIGVVGTDVYDKLLILRALRKQFPRAWFFTTDVDAELFRPDEYANTRNLLIASHFGLELNPQLQRSTPPFRDSYQTSVFLAMLYGLDDSHVKQTFGDRNNFWHAKHRDALPADPWLLKPLIFELGRSGPYQLTNTQLDHDTATARVQTASPRERDWSNRRAIASVAILIVLLGLSVIHSSRLRRLLGNGSLGQSCLRIAIVAAVAFAVAYGIHDSSRQPDGEPFLVFEGISLWPPILIRALAAILGIFLLRSAIRIATLHLGPEGIANALLNHSSANDDRQIASGDGPAAPSWWRLLETIRNRVLDERGIEQGQKPWAVWSDAFGDQRTTVSTLVEAYRTQCGLAHRTARVLIIGAAVCIFSLSSFSLTDPPLQPFRGQVCGTASNLSIFAAGIVLMVVTGFVVDALWLCRLLIRQLAKASADWQVAAFPPDDPRRDVLTVRFIGRLTQSIGKLTWYPLALVLLLILARSKMFDVIDFSWSLLLLWGMIGTLIILVTLGFRRTAIDARDSILGRLRDIRNGLHVSEAPPKAIEPIQQAIKEILREEAGAFRPFAQDPLFNSLLVFFGGSGGIVLLEQLIPYL